MAAYSEHVVISTGKNDWKSRIEDEYEEESGPGYGRFLHGLKGLIGRGGEYHDVGKISCARSKSKAGVRNLLILIFIAI
jgi:hypothetical protein